MEGSLALWTALLGVWAGHRVVPPPELRLKGMAGLQEGFCQGCRWAPLSAQQGSQSSAAAAV